MVAWGPTHVANDDSVVVRFAGARNRAVAAGVEITAGTRFRIAACQAKESWRDKKDPAGNGDR